MAPSLSSFGFFGEEKREQGGGEGGKNGTGRGGKKKGKKTKGGKKKGKRGAEYAKGKPRGNPSLRLGFPAGLSKPLWGGCGVLLGVKAGPHFGKGLG